MRAYANEREEKSLFPSRSHIDALHMPYIMYCLYDLTNQRETKSETHLVDKPSVGKAIP